MVWVRLVSTSPSAAPEGVMIVMDAVENCCAVANCSYVSAVWQAMRITLNLIKIPSEDSRILQLATW